MIINRKTKKKKTYSYYRCNKALCDHLCDFRKRVSQNLLETYLLENLETEYAKNMISYHVENANQQSSQKERSKESYLKELDRLNLLFQKERISWEYYDSEYAKIQEKLKTLKPERRQKQRNIDYMKKILDSGFKKMYTKLSEENRQSFWQNIIREIHINEDSSIQSIDFY